MKRFRPAMLVLFSSIIIALVFFGAQLQVPTALAYKGGAGSFNPQMPTAVVCTPCHSGTTPATGSVTINFPKGTTGYTPGGPAIPMSVTVTDPTLKEWGFQLTAVFASNLASQAGTFTAAGTQASNVNSNGAVEGSSPTSNNFTFTWTPPPTGTTDTVNFYVTGIALPGSPGGNSFYTAMSPLGPATSGNTAPTITTNPASQAVAASSNATFTAAASGTPTPSVQWQVSTGGGTTFTNIGGATSATLTLTAVTAAQSGNKYQAVFTNTAGTATSSAATLTVNQAPTITSLNNTAFTVGTMGTFMMTATGTPMPTLSETGPLPGGVTFAPATGVLSGTPTASGTFSITLTAQNGIPPNAMQTFTLTVNPASTGAGPLTATPTSMSFTYQVGGTLPGRQTLVIASSGGPTSYTATVSDSWVRIDRTSGTTGTSGNINVSVNPAGMAPGTYNAQINIPGIAIPVYVHLTINPGSGGGGTTPGNMYAQPYVSSSRSGTLAAAWVNYLGASPNNPNDPRNQGLVLATSAASPSGSMAGVTIQGVTGMNLTELSFDLRADIPCAGSLLQFQVTTMNGNTQTYGGCKSSTAAPTTSAPTGWTHVQFDLTQPTLALTSPVQSIRLVLDKGTSSTGSITVIDNIQINKVPVGKGAAPTPNPRDD